MQIVEYNLSKRDIKNKKREERTKDIIISLVDYGM